MNGNGRNGSLSRSREHGGSLDESTSSLNGAARTPPKRSPAPPGHTAMVSSPVSSLSNASTVVDLTEKNVVVALRVRPLRQGGEMAMTTSTNRAVLVNPRTFKASADAVARAAEELRRQNNFTADWARVFKFDHVFGTGARDQADDSEAVFEALGRPLVDAAVSLRRACIFSYGPEDSGRSHSIFGNLEEPGATDAADAADGAGPEAGAGEFFSWFSRGGKVVDGPVDGGTDGANAALLDDDGISVVGRDLRLPGDPLRASRGLAPRVLEALLARVLAINEAGGALRLRVAVLSIAGDKLTDLLCNYGAGDAEHPPARPGGKGLRIREHPEHGPFVESLRSVALEDHGTVRRCLRHATESWRDGHVVVHVTLRMDGGRGGAGSVYLVDLEQKESTEARRRAAHLQTLSTIAVVLKQMKKGVVDGMPHRQAPLTWLLRDALSPGATSFFLAHALPDAAHHQHSLRTLAFAEKLLKTPSPSDAPRSAGRVGRTPPSAARTPLRQEEHPELWEALGGSQAGTASSRQLLFQTVADPQQRLARAAAARAQRERLARRVSVRDFGVQASLGGAQASSAARQELWDAQAAKVELEIEVNALAVDRDVAVAEATQATERLRSADAKVAALQAKLSAAEERAAEEAAALRRQVSVGRQDRDQVLDEVDTLRDLNAKLRSDASILGEHARGLRKDLADKEDAVKAANARLVEAEQALLREGAEARRAVATAESAAARAPSAEEVQALRGALEDAEEDRVALQEALRGLQQAEVRAREAEALRRAEAAREREALLRERDALSSAARDVERAGEEASAALRRERDSFATSLEESREELAGARAQLADSRAQLAAAKEKLNGTRNELAAAKEQLAAADEQVVSMGEELMRTKEALATARGELAATKEELSGTKNDLTEATEKLAGATEELTEAKERLTSTQERLTGTQEQLTGLCRERDASAAQKERAAGADAAAVTAELARARAQHAADVLRLEEQADALRRQLDAAATSAAASAQSPAVGSEVRDVRRLSKAVRDLREEGARRLEQAESALEEERQLRERLQRELQDVRQSLRSVTEAHSASTDGTSAVEGALDDERRLRSALEEENRRLSALLRSGEQQMEAVLEDLLRDVREHHRPKEELLGAMQQKLFLLAKERQESAGRADAFQQRLREREAEHAKMAKVYARQITALWGAVKSLEDMQAENEETIRALRKERDEAHGQARRVAMQVADLEERRHDLQRELVGIDGKLISALQKHGVPNAKVIAMATTTADMGGGSATPATPRRASLPGDSPRELRGSSAFRRPARSSLGSETPVLSAALDAGEEDPEVWSEAVERQIAALAKYMV